VRSLGPAFAHLDLPLPLTVDPDLPLPLAFSVRSRCVANACSLTCDWRGRQAVAHEGSRKGKDGGERWEGGGGGREGGGGVVLHEADSIYLDVLTRGEFFRYSRRCLARLGPARDLRAPALVCVCSRAIDLCVSHVASSYSGTNVRLCLPPGRRRSCRLIGRKSRLQGRVASPIQLAMNAFDLFYHLS